MYNNTAKAGNGGAIENFGTLNVSQVNGFPQKTNEIAMFQDNSAQDNGGAVDSNSGSAGGSLNVSGPVSADNILGLNYGTISFVNNQAMTGSGGAINTADNTVLKGVNFGSTPIVSFDIGNKAAVNGGAVNAIGGTNGSKTLNVTSCSFDCNQAGVVINVAGEGNAIATSAITDVEKSSFSHNGDPTANGTVNGGAIAYEINNQKDPPTPFNSSLTLNQDEFNNNFSANLGGAVLADVKVNSGLITVQVTNSTFWLNTARDGGGVDIEQDATNTATVTTTLTNDTFFQNTAGRAGGGIDLILTKDATGTNAATLTSLTVYENQAGGSGGGVFISSVQNVEVDNNIFAGNQIPGGGPQNVTLSLGTSLNDIGYNMVGLLDNMFNKANHDIFTVNPGLANALAQNDAPLGYTQTLALADTSPG